MLKMRPPLFVCAKNIFKTCLLDRCSFVWRMTWLFLCLYGCLSTCQNIRKYLLIVYGRNPTVSSCCWLAFHGSLRLFARLLLSVCRPKYTPRRLSTWTSTVIGRPPRWQIASWQSPAPANCLATHASPVSRCPLVKTCFGRIGSPESWRPWQWSSTNTGPKKWLGC